MNKWTKWFIEHLFSDYQKERRTMYLEWQTIGQIINRIDAHKSEESSHDIADR